MVDYKVGAWNLCQLALSLIFSISPQNNDKTEVEVELVVTRGGPRVYY